MQLALINNYVDAKAVGSGDIHIDGIPILGNTDFTFTIGMETQVIKAPNTLPSGIQQTTDPLAVSSLTINVPG